MEEEAATSIDGPPVLRRLGTLDDAQVDFASNQCTPVHLFDFVSALVVDDWKTCCEPLLDDGRAEDGAAVEPSASAARATLHSQHSSTPARGAAALETRASADMLHALLQPQLERASIETRLLALEHGAPPVHQLAAPAVPVATQQVSSRAYVHTTSSPRGMQAAESASSGEGLTAVQTARRQRMVAAAAALKAAAAVLQNTDVGPGTPSVSSRSSATHRAGESTQTAACSDAAQRVAEFTAAALKSARARRMQARNRPSLGIAAPGPVHSAILMEIPVARSVAHYAGIASARDDFSAVSPQSPPPRECDSVCESVLHGPLQKIPNTPMSPEPTPRAQLSRRDALLQDTRREEQRVARACDAAIQAGQAAHQVRCICDVLRRAMQLLRRGDEVDRELDARATATAATADAAVRSHEKAMQELAAAQAFSSTCAAPITTYVQSMQRAVDTAHAHAVSCVTEAREAAVECARARRQLADDWQELRPQLDKVHASGAARPHSVRHQSVLAAIEAAVQQGEHALHSTVPATDRAAAMLVGAVASHQARTRALLAATDGAVE